ncbi:MAG: sodium-dependent bicarbonate transport family permease [Caldilineaceae bacterium]
MNTIDLVQMNLSSPMVLAFVLGVGATLLKSDLRLPETVYTFLSIYLLFAIGLKGGFALAQTELAALWLPVLATLGLGMVIPVWCYALLRWLGSFGVADAAALAAHFGSVSAVTFSAGLTFLDELNVAYEGFMPTLMALMEIPAIAVALIIAHYRLAAQKVILPAPGQESEQSASNHQSAVSWQHALHEVLTGKSIVLLAGGLLIGWVAGEPGYQQIAPFFLDLFPGMLTLFLLELGVTAGRWLRDLRQVGVFLVGFSTIMPVLHGALGIWLGYWSGLSLGGSMLLGLLAASASYIAAPAAVRIALPQANPCYYLTAAIALAFPFNLTVGLPLYFMLAQMLY